MSKVMSITLSDDVYEMLLERSKKLGLSKSGYVTFSLKKQFESEDVLEKMPDIMYQLKSIKDKLEENK